MNFDQLRSGFASRSGDFEVRTSRVAARGEKARRGISARAKKSGVAGSALIAAMIGAEFAEQAAAARETGDGGDDLAFLKSVKICAGHVGLAGTRAERGGHEEHATHEGSSAIEPRHDGHDRDLRTFFATGADRDHAQSHFSHVMSGGARHHAGDDHSVSLRTNGSGHGRHDAAATNLDVDPTGGTEGHAHSTSNLIDTSLPHTMTPAMQAQHAALMNLVPAAAATHVAVNNGSWFDPHTWAGGQVPGAHAKVLIPQGVTVEYDGKSAASLFTVRVDGELDFATDVDTFMEVDTFVVSTTGTLTIGTETNPVDPNVSAVISFADNGPINVRWDPLLLSRGLISEGAVDIHGAEKEAFLKVAVDPMKGDTTLKLDGAPDGWQVGDKIVLAGTHLVPSKSGGPNTPVTSQTQDEELIITAINGDVITVNKPLAFDHEAPRADLKTYVANYSRNVTFENEGGASTDVHERGHVMLMHSDDVVVKYAEFDELGRTDKSVRSFDVATLTSVAPDSNIRGRYALHLHMTGVGDPQHPAVVEGNAVWGSPGWGFVQHASNALLSNNAAYDVFGAAFVAESGNEVGRWDHNIAIKSLGVDHITKDGNDVNAFDLGRTGTGFWFQGRLVEAVDNVAASVPSGAGFTYFHRGTSSSLIPIDPASSNLGDSLRYVDDVLANIPSISIFQGNESFATQMGLEIIKANPRQDSDVRSVIDNFTAWEVKTGVHIEYSAHYTLTNLDLVASDSAGIGAKFTNGLELSKNVFDIVVNGANIAGFYRGVEQIKLGVSGLQFMNGKDQWEYVYIDVNVTGAHKDFTNVTPGDRFLAGSQLHHGALDYDSAFAETYISQAHGVYNLLGTKTDSLGKTASYDAWDPDYINATELRGSIEQNGFWTTPDGRRVALIEEYHSDRATGELIKVGLFVEIPTSYVLQAGKFTRITPVDNGLLNLNSHAPTAGDDTARVDAGNSVIIDVLANDRDADGDAIHLDGIHSQHGHVVDNADGTVTYFADPNFSGEDVFYYWVQDTNGDITKAQVTVTVDA